MFLRIKHGLLLSLRLRAVALALRVGTALLRREIPGRFGVAAECVALYDADHQRREAIVVRSGVTDDRADQRHVVVLNAAAESVGQQSLGDVSNELRRIAKHRFSQSGDAVHLAAVDKYADRVDRLPLVFRSPMTDRIKVLERDADRIHDLVAALAGLDRTMHFHLLAQRERLAAFARRIQRRYRERRWIRRLDADDVLKHPLPTLHQ